MTCPKIMAIVNLTADSYYAPSRCLNNAENVDLAKVESMIQKHINEGADIIDIGPCSSRPNSEPIGEEREWQRLKPTLELIKTNFPGLRISIDSYYSSHIAKAEKIIGDFIVNDISAGEDDELMLKTVAEHQLEYIAMHKRGNSLTMQSLCDYPNGVVNEVKEYFEKFASKADNLGIKNWILDPGFGFAKSLEQNYELLRGLDVFKSFSKEILVGISRKSMIFRYFNTSPEESLASTQVLHYYSLCHGANILRVHDVREAKECISLYKKLNLD